MGLILIKELSETKVCQLDNSVTGEEDWCNEPTHACQHKNHVLQDCADIGLTVLWFDIPMEDDSSGSGRSVAVMQSQGDANHGESDSLFIDVSAKRTKAGQ